MNKQPFNENEQQQKAIYDVNNMEEMEQNNILFLVRGDVKYYFADFVHIGAVGVSDTQFDSI